MSTVVVALSVALVLGWLTGGSLDRLGSLPVRGLWLPVAAVGLQVLGALSGSSVGYAAGLASSVLLVGVFLARNRTLTGVGLVTLGLLSNAAVVLANGAMPVSLTAAARAGLSTGVLLDDGRHELLSSRSHLAPLADRVPVLLPLRPEVVSIGDVLIAAGLAQLVVVGMRRRELTPAVTD